MTCEGRRDARPDPSTSGRRRPIADESFTVRPLAVSTGIFLYLSGRNSSLPVYERHGKKTPETYDDSGVIPEPASHSTSVWGTPKCFSMSRTLKHGGLKAPP
jgi:hypothetical protein